MSNENKSKREELLKLMHKAVATDSQLREQYHVGEKFRFIRDRLKALLSRIEEGIASLRADEKESRREKVATEDEVHIYVYLFNAQGSQLRTWSKMLNPAVFYEHSVNRPIYDDKKFVEAVIRSKTNKSQHGYLTMLVNKQDILTERTKDSLGNTVIKVKEGALNPTRLISFTHNEVDYKLNEEGELIKHIT